MKRALFLDNPRQRWTQTPRVAQTPAEYASSIHYTPAPAGYPRLWWVIVIGCGVYALALL